MPFLPRRILIAGAILLVGAIFLVYFLIELLVPLPAQPPDEESVQAARETIYDARTNPVESRPRGGICAA